MNAPSNPPITAAEAIDKLRARLLASLESEICAEHLDFTAGIERAIEIVKETT